jgi:hypothetical protein
MQDRSTNTADAVLRRRKGGLRRCGTGKLAFEPSFAQEAVCADQRDLKLVVLAIVVASAIQKSKCKLIRSRE